MSELPFTLHAIKGYIAVLFLIEYADRLLLLDGGARFDAARVENYMTAELQRSPRELALALVTHMHPDHAGGAPLLRRRWATKIAAHRDIDRWYRGFAGGAQHLVDTLLGHYSARQQFGHLERAWYPRRLRPDYGLTDGDAIPAFPDWQALAAPGHTLYDLVFYHAGSATLYAGDLLVKVGSGIVLPFPTLFPELMRQSLERLAGLPVRRLLLAHGGELELDDSRAFFAAFIPRVGEVGRASFRWIKPFCSMAPDVRERARRPPKIKTR
ncbi:MAG: MBL fold metallo-hydrolase [Deltaproteobacteria bacterium]|nr:MBL fold metallo-hydrolase [Deltaproteobacteria bacterium]